jgi:DNA polymerase
MLRIDFETRSEIDLKTRGAWVYAEHESTLVLCLAYQVDDAPVEICDPMGPFSAAPWSLRAAIQGAGPIEAHNVLFERAIYEKILVGRFDWPPIRPTRWKCSAALSRAFGLPGSLENAGKALGLADQKDPKGRRLMLKLCKASGKAPSAPELAGLYDYCQKDVLAERAVSAELGELSETELAVLRLEHKINTRGILVDLDAVEGALEIIARLDELAIQRTKEITGGAVDSPLQVAALASWINSRGVYVPNLQRETVETLAISLELPEDVREILGLRLSMSRSSTRKFRAMKDRTSRDGRVRSTLVYCGAERTGRFSGSGIQIQNFPRGSLKPDMVEIALDAIRARDLDLLRLLWADPMSVLSSCLRGCLVAAPGREFIAADFASIEARVLFWLAGDNRALDIIRNGRDLYVDMATAIFSAPANEIDKTRRDLGKRTVLGAGYGMGPDKFLATCKAAGVELSPGLAERAIKTYRRRFSQVPKLWSIYEATARRVILSGRAAQVRTPEYKPVPIRFLMVDKPRRALAIELPSGRRLHYYDPEVEPDLSYAGTDPKSHKWARIGTYGGKLVENVTQATARDILIESMLKLENAGFPIVASIHDEAVSEIDEGERTTEEFVEIMSRAPQWIGNCPIAASGWRGKRFQK